MLRERLVVSFEDHFLVGFMGQLYKMRLKKRQALMGTRKKAGIEGW